MEHATKTRRAHYRAAMRVRVARIASTVLAFVGAMVAIREVNGEMARHIREVPEGEWYWRVSTVLVGIVGALVATLVEDSPWLRVEGPPAVVHYHRRDYADGGWDEWTSWSNVLDRDPTSSAPIVSVFTTAYVNPGHDEWWDTPCHKTDTRHQSARRPDGRGVPPGNAAAFLRRVRPIPFIHAP